MFSLILGGGHCPAAKVGDIIDWNSMELSWIQCIKKQRYFPDKGPSSQSYAFSCSHVRIGQRKTVSQRIDAFELWC